MNPCICHDSNFDEDSLTQKLIPIVYQKFISNMKPLHNFQNVLETTTVHDSDLQMTDRKFFARVNDNPQFEVTYKISNESAGNEVRPIFNKDKASEMSSVTVRDYRLCNTYINTQLQSNLYISTEINFDVSKGLRYRGKNTTLNELSGPPNHFDISILFLKSVLEKTKFKCNSHKLKYCCSSLAL